MKKKEKSEEPGKEKKQKTEKTTGTSTASSAKKVPEQEEEIVRLQALVEEKEEAINDLADDLVKVRAIVAEKEKKLEERRSKLADYYEKDNANVKKYNQELITKNEAFVEEIKQLRYQLKEKDKLIENLKQ